MAQGKDPKRLIMLLCKLVIWKMSKFLIQYICMCQKKSQNKKEKVKAGFLIFFFLNNLKNGQRSNLKN